MATIRIIPMHVHSGHTIAQSLNLRTNYAINPEKTNRGMQELQHQELFMEKTDDVQMKQQMRMPAAQGVSCPHCGSVNEPGAMFCASCGNPLGKITCPNCGA